MIELIIRILKLCLKRCYILVNTNDIILATGFYTDIIEYLLQGRIHLTVQEPEILTIPLIENVYLTIL